MNEKPDQGKLRTFADANLIRRRRTLFNFAQASSLPIPNGYAEKQKGRPSSRPSGPICRPFYFSFDSFAATKYFATVRTNGRASGGVGVFPSRTVLKGISEP